MNPEICFENSSSGLPEPAREFLCSIWPLYPEEEQLSLGDPIFSNRTVLVGTNLPESEESVLELPKAGTYVVELRYPNGASLRSTIFVVEGERYRYLVPTSKQQVFKKSSPAPSPNVVPRVLSAALKSVGLQAPDLEIKSVSQKNVIPLKNLREFVTEIDSSSRENEIVARVLTADLTFSMVLPNGVVHSFRNGYDRKWLVISSRGKSQTLVAYPFGWAGRDGDAFSLFMNRVAEDGVEATKWSVFLKLMDPVYGSLVEHLTRRDVQSSVGISQSLRGQATSALYEKEDNPFAAVAAAYLFALNRSDLESGREWMENLCNRFEWLPDGPIALGWKLLRNGGRNTETWREARHLFIASLGRGLPYYTVGLHILVEALTTLLMADPSDKEVEGMLTDMRAVDVACVRDEPFITFQVQKFLGLPVKY